MQAKKQKILIVDDDDNVSSFISDVVESEGYTALVASGRGNI